jgi:lipid II:glycine glycyltransferase (peptidoglycan interpeptide bridge formation enzyme)
MVVPAKRGKHLSVPYGPVVGKCEVPGSKLEVVRLIVEELRKVAIERGCSFIRLSPFWVKEESGYLVEELSKLGLRPSPLHLLAEHIWYLDLKGRIEEGLLMAMRATTRNLIRRAEKEGVTVQPSSNPIRDFHHFWRLYEATGERHGFVLYQRDLLLNQLEMYHLKDQAKLYLAKHNVEVLAASIHMSYGGITSYHHGAGANTKIPASYLLQWRAIQDALRRGDRIYNFWGIAPTLSVGSTKSEIRNPNHPFAGVTMFKTGFGGQLLELVHCMDLPLTTRYIFTWSMEKFRKVKRGF